MPQNLSLIIDQANVQANVAKIKSMPATIDGKYYRDLSLEDYATFTPWVYQSLTRIIDEILSEKTICRILEIGSGDGVAAQAIKERFGKQVEYTGLDVLPPVFKQSMQWIKSDFDNFKPQQKFDLIFSEIGRASCRERV